MGVRVAPAAATGMSPAQVQAQSLIQTQAPVSQPEVVGGETSATAVGSGLAAKKFFRTRFALGGREEGGGGVFPVSCSYHP